MFRTALRVGSSTVVALLCLVCATAALGDETGVFTYFYPSIFYTPGTPVTVGIRITQYSWGTHVKMEDQFPTGWAISSITSPGTIVNGKVVWDLALGGGQSRTLTYVATPPSNASGTYVFRGKATFSSDSTSQTATADRALVPQCNVSCLAGASTSSGPAPLPVQFTGSATGASCQEQPAYDWDFGDGSAHSSQQSPAHTYSQAGTYLWSMTASADGIGCTRTGSITVTQCTLSCSASSTPRWGQPPLAVQFNGSAVPSGCTGSVAYDWDFGDGSAHGSGPSATHTFAASGSYTWKMTASADATSCTSSGKVAASQVPPIDLAGDYVFVASTSAHVGGALGTNWVTDMVLHNPGASAATAFVYFLQRDTDNSAALGHRIAVPAGSSVKLADVVDDTLAKAGFSGAILVGADHQLIVTSRTFNNASSGTYGQYVAGYRLEKAITVNEAVRLIQLTEGTRYRTNIGFASASGTPLAISVSLHKATGELLGVRNYTVPPYGYVQDDRIINKVTSAQIDDAYAVISSPTEGARYFTYASVIDNGTGDPVCVVPVGRGSAQASAPPDQAANLDVLSPRHPEGAERPKGRGQALQGGRGPSLAPLVKDDLDFAAPAQDDCNVMAAPNSMQSQSTEELQATTSPTYRQWQDLQLEGGQVNSIAVSVTNPAVVFAAVQGGGLLKSTDGGGSWLRLESFESPWAQSVVFDPNAPATVYVASSGGVIKSPDAGVTWQGIGNGLPGGGYAVVVEPAHPGTLYALLYGKGVYKTTNGGQSWVEANQGLSSFENTNDLTIDPIAPATLYATNWGGGVFKSTNGAQSWTASNNGLPDSALNAHAIRVDPASSATVYLAADGGVYKSTTGGASWTRVYDRGTSCLNIDARAPGTVYAAGDFIFKTTDHGTTWTTLNTGGRSSFNTIVIDPSTASTLYAGFAAGGVAKSLDGGTTWTTINHGLHAANVTSMVISRGSPASLYAATRGAGVFKRTLTGGDWTSVNAGLDDSWVNSLLVDRTSATTLYAATDCMVFKTTNGGASWLAVGNMGCSRISSLAQDALASTTLYAGAHGGGVLKTTDGGTSFSTVNSGLGGAIVTAVVTDPQVSGTVYAVTESSGLFKSSDGGGQWTSIYPPPAAPLRALAIDPTAPETLYLAGDSTVVKSTNGGATWVAIDAQWTGSMVVDPTAPAVVWAGSWTILRSGNAGATFVPIPSGLGQIPGVTLTLDPAQGTVYAGFQGLGVWKMDWETPAKPKTDFRWTPVSPLPGQPVRFTDLSSGPPTSWSWSFGDGGSSTQQEPAHTFTSPGAYTVAFTAANGFGSQSTSHTITVQQAPAPNAWVGLGPDGGEISSLAVDPTNPSVVLAAACCTNSGIFRSTDGATTWERATIDRTEVSAMVFDPHTPTIAYAAAGNVYKSVDGGATWSPSGAGIGDIRALAIHPSLSATVFAVARNEGVHRSTDSGATWSALGTGFPANPDLTRLVIDPQTPTTMYAGSQSRGVFKTSDGGATWSASSTGLKDLELWGLAIDPAHPATLYAATTDGLYKSTDGAQSWVDSTGTMPRGRTSRSVLVNPQQPSTLYASDNDQLYKSLDGGATWLAINNGHVGGVFSLAVAASVPTTLYVGHWGQGVSKTTDGGGLWVPMSTGLTGTRVYALAVPSSAPATVFAGTSQGLFTSTDSGLTWTAAVTGGWSGAIALDPSAPRTAYSGSRSICRTTDGWVSWSCVWEPFSSTNISSIVVDPATPTTVYAGTNPLGMFKSTDSGATWTKINAGLTDTYVQALALAPGSPPTLYAGTQNGAIYKSSNGGGSWTALSTGLPQNNWVQALAITPGTPGTVYAGTSNGVYKTTDAGAHWAAAVGGSQAFGGVNALVIDPNAPATVWAGGDRVYRSVDGGASWSRISSGLPNVGVSSLVLDGQTPAAIYAGFDGGSVYRMTCDPSACQLTLSHTLKAFSAQGGSDTITVSANSGNCPWTAVPSAGWVTITSGGSGVGDGTVAYSVASNTSNDARSATITVGGQTFTVSQAGMACGAPMTPSLTSPSTASSGFGYTVSWTATSPDDLYDLEESTSASFSGASPVRVTRSSSSFTHTVSAATIYYSRVRAVDNCHSQDYVSAWSHAGQTTVYPPVSPTAVIYVPAAAAVGGSAGTNWLTDLEVHNPGNDQVTYTMALLKRNEPNPAPLTHTHTLEGGQSVRYGNILQSVFAFSGAATIRFVPTLGTVMVTSRTYNDQPQGTYGQFIPGRGENEALTTGQSARLVQLSQSASTTSGFRTNLGLVSACDATITVNVSLYRGNGNLIGTKSYDLRSYETRQIDRIFTYLTAETVDDGFAVVTTSSPGARLFAYASVIDNRSGDPIFTPAEVIAP